MLVDIVESLFMNRFVNPLLLHSSTPFGRFITHQLRCFPQKRIFNVWNSQYRDALPLLAISAFQVLAIKDGSYNAFLQSSALIGFFLLAGIFLRRGLKRDFTGIGCVALALSTSVTFFQSLA